MARAPRAGGARRRPSPSPGAATSRRSSSPEAARVPGGADAGLPGPRRVRASAWARSTVEGAEAVAALRLDELVRPRPAEVFRREKAESARDAMRRRLAGAGRWRAAVELRETYDPGARASWTSCSTSSRGRA